MSTAGQWGWLEWSVASLPFAVPGLILGLWFLGNRRAFGSDKPRSGAVHWARLLLGAAVLYLVTFGLLLSFVAKPFFGARAAAHSAACQRNLRSLSSALVLYAADWNDRLPPVKLWREAAPDYLPLGTTEAVFKCPLSTEHTGYALNPAVSGKQQDQLDPRGVLLFEPNESDGVGPQRLDRRHSGTAFVALVDGSVQRVSGEREPTLLWNPVRSVHTGK